MEANDKYSGALEVGLARSRIAPAFVAAAVAASFGVLAFTPLASAHAILVATWVSCAGLSALARSRSSHRLAIARSGEVAIDEIAGTLRGGSFVAPWLTIVRWRPADTHFDRTLLVTPDMLAPDVFRELRVILKACG